MSREVMAAYALDFLLSDNGEFGQISRLRPFSHRAISAAEARAIGPALEILDDVGMARAAVGARLSLFGQFAR
jgi:hypothetical protein